MANIPKFRDYTKKELKAINELFTPYLFYKDTDRKHRHCICTRCRQEYDVTSDNYELFTTQHNEKVVCTKCGNTVTAKSIGKAKTCKNLWEEQRAVTIYRVDENTVHIKADEFVKNYYRDGLNPAPRTYHSNRYVLRPGSAKQFIYSYYCGWGESKSFGEPFYIKSSGSYWAPPPDNSYTVFGLNRLDNTFLRYNMLDEYEDRYYQEHANRNYIYIKYITYLCQFVMHPQIELLQKLGYYDIVFNLVENNSKSYPYVNWGADNVMDFFKMTKQEFKEFRQNGGDLKLLKMVWVMKKHFKSKTPIRSALETTEALKGEYIAAKADVLRDAIADIKKEKLPITDTVKYLIKKQNQSKDFAMVEKEYFDYYRMGKALKYDFTNHNVLYPKALTRAHDLANETHTIWLEEQEAKREAILSHDDKQHNIGACEEVMAASGLTNSGYSESSQVSMYNTYQNRIATARESYNQAVQNYNNSITEARMQNNTVLAEIAYNALQQQLELSLQGFQYKNSLVTEKLNQKTTVENNYWNRYQDVLDQINTENALAEQKRQFDADYALQQKQLAQEQAQWEKEYALQQQQLKASQAAAITKTSNDSWGNSGSIDKGTTISTKYYNGPIAENVGGFGYMGKDNNGVAYQPRGVYINGQAYELDTTGKTAGEMFGKNAVNSSGVNIAKQNVWTAGGQKFIWNGTKNQYERVG